MAKHEAPEPRPAAWRRRATRHIWHPATHILTLVSLHVVALSLIEKAHAFAPLIPS
jgi:hypothetical protein